MEWLTESIEKVICFVQERPLYLMCRQPNLHELARKFDARHLRKKLLQVSCASFLTVCHHHKSARRRVTGNAVLAVDLSSKPLRHIQVLHFLRPDVLPFYHGNKLSDGQFVKIQL